MPRVRINDEALHSGAGVEGRRKREDPPAGEELPETGKKKPAWRGRPVFEDLESDIFYTKRD
ncbi:MAG: hypothetical protein GX882_08480 [Methanomicrobiales archaeon]|nr:hypothetical protein [Methanomicrobiales archaeon]